MNINRSYARHIAKLRMEKMGIEHKKKRNFFRTNWRKLANNLPISGGKK